MGRTSGILSTTSMEPLEMQSEAAGVNGAVQSPEASDQVVRPAPPDGVIAAALEEYRGLVRKALKELFEHRHVRT